MATGKKGDFCWFFFGGEAKAAFARKEINSAVGGILWQEGQSAECIENLRFCSAGKKNEDEGGKKTRREMKKKFGIEMEMVILNKVKKKKKKKGEKMNGK